MRVRFKWIIAILIMHYSVLPGYRAWAYEADSNPVLEVRKADYIRQLYAVIQEDIQDVTDTIPGYSYRDIKVPGLLVGDITGRTEEEVDAGYAIADMVRYELTKLNSEYLYVPTYHFYYRDRDAISKIYHDKEVNEQIKALSALWGIENYTVGSISINEDVISLDLDIYTRQAVLHKQWNGNKNDLIGSIPTLCQSVLTSIDNQSGLTPSRDDYPGDFESLVKYGEFVRALSIENREALLADAQALWDAGYKYPAVGVKILTSLSPAFSEEHKFENSMWDVNSSLDHPHVHALYNQMMAFNGANRDRARYLNDLKRLASRYPYDPTMLSSVSRILAGKGNEPDAIGVSINLLSRWPDSHRSWNEMANSLFQYSWYIRGNGYASTVSSDQWRQFNALQRLAYEAAENCEYIAKGHAICLLDKIILANGYSDELYDLFVEAVKMEPYNQYIYSNMLTFASPKWGGSLEMQATILEIARNHNPDAKWVEDIRERWAPGVSAPISVMTIFAIVFLVILSLLAVFIIRNKKGT